MSHGRMSGLKVVALISGGKDSIFSILHCQAQGHEVVALANLHPPANNSHGDQEHGNEGLSSDLKSHEVVEEEIDMDSYMYQTVGHSITPLFSEMLGLPLYRRAIRGSARDSNREYGQENIQIDAQITDETEDLIPLLQEVMKAQPKVNAVSTGAILSTYQRTRVESIALRLGLVPLSYLWQFPYLPPYDDASLLRDMEAVGLDARIIKVASGGLDERLLWSRLSESSGWTRVRHAMLRFLSMGGGADLARLDVGAVLGEGGEFETLAIDGPAPLFIKSIVFDKKVIVVGEGGSASVHLKAARLQAKYVDTSAIDAAKASIASSPAKPTKDLRLPPLLDDDILRVSEKLDIGTDAGSKDTDRVDQAHLEQAPGSLTLSKISQENLNSVQRFANLHSSRLGNNTTAAAQLQDILEDLTSTLSSGNQSSQSSHADLPDSLSSVNPLTRAIHTTLLLRDMADFASVNAIYAKYFGFTLPPSRVTVACGEALPPNVRVLLSVTMQGATDGPSPRKGLHVQSRSYWAPANIGPYSQARALPLEKLISSKEEIDGNADQELRSSLEIVSIAGQIPLMPATMDMASAIDVSSQTSETKTFKLQTVLALQHLCRVGRAVNVRFFTSAIAMLGRSREAGMGQWKAKTAGQAWRSLHEDAYQRWQKAHSESNPDEADDEEEEVDIWDLRNRLNRHMIVEESGSTQTAKTMDTRQGLELPDYSMVQRRSRSDNLQIPSFYAVEVAQLPRDAGIEWCSSGIARQPGSTSTGYISCLENKSQHKLRVETVNKDREGRSLVFSTQGFPLSAETSSLEDTQALLHKLRERNEGSGLTTVYVSCRWRRSAEEERILSDCGAQVIPCFNVWDSEGRAMGCLIATETVEMS